MNLLDVLRGLVRRWYITVPGLLVAVGLAVGVWTMTPPQYERTASQLLLPGEGVLPDGATNEFLYTGGLTPVADILTRAVSAHDLVRGFVEQGAEVTIARDAAASSPVVVIKVTADSDAQAAAMLDAIVKQDEVTLAALQADQGIPEDDRVTISNISVDERSTVRERSRIVLTLVAGVVTVLLVLALASLVDGIAMKRKRRMTASAKAGADVDDVPSEPVDAVEPATPEPEVEPEFAPVANERSAPPAAAKKPRAPKKPTRPKKAAVPEVVAKEEEPPAEPDSPAEPEPQAEDEPEVRDEPEVAEPEVAAEPEADHEPADEEEPDDDRDGDVVGVGAAPKRPARPRPRPRRAKPPAGGR